MGADGFAGYVLRSDFWVVGKMTLFEATVPATPRLAVLENERTLAKSIAEKYLSGHVVFLEI